MLSAAAIHEIKFPEIENPEGILENGHIENTNIYYLICYRHNTFIYMALFLIQGIGPFLLFKKDPGRSGSHTQRAKRPKNAIKEPLY